MTAPEEDRLTAPDEGRLEESQELIDEAKKIAHDLREQVPDTDGEPPDEGSPANSSDQGGVTVVPSSSVPMIPTEVATSTRAGPPVSDSGVFGGTTIASPASAVCPWIVTDPDST